MAAVCRGEIAASAEPDEGLWRSLDGGVSFLPLRLAGDCPWDVEVDPLGSYAQGVLTWSE